MIFAKRPFIFMIIFSVCCLSLTSCYKDSDSSSDDVLGNWKRSYDFEGVPRTEAVSFVIGDKAYVATGYQKEDERLKDLYEFDLSTGTWLKKASMPVELGRNSAVAFTINGKGYIGTGYDGTKYLKDFWEYDPEKDTWTQKKDFGGSARYGAVGFSINGKGYISSGYDDNHLRDLWEYDPAADTWTQKASLGGSKRVDAVAFVIKNKAYVCTGVNAGSYLDDMWEYDPETNVWTEKRRIIDSDSDNSFDDDYDYNIVRSSATVLVQNDKAYLTSGEQSNSIINTTWQYDPATDLWTKKTSFEGVARKGAVGFTLNNRIFMATGNNSSYRFEDVWEFNPDVEQVSND